MLEHASDERLLREREALGEISHPPSRRRTSRNAT